MPQEAERTCDALAHVSVPDQDRPTLADVRVFNNGACFAGEIYYSSAPDHFRKARLCVLTELGLFRSGTESQQAKTAQSVVSGGATYPGSLDVLDSAVLGMIYANGEGVQKNLPLARRFVCGSSDGVGGDSLQDDLNDFEKALKTSGHYDACAVNTYRSMSYRCGGIEIQHMSATIDHEESAIAASLPAAVRPSFKQLGVAWKALAATASRLFAIGCGSGTGCGGFEGDYDLDYMKQWMTLLRTISENRPAAANVSASSFALLDRQLNQVYRKTVASNAGDDCDAYDCAALRAATLDDARAWLRYRDAWVKFGTQRWPNITADQWRAWQTVERLKPAQ